VREMLREKLEAQKEAVEE
jgi:hypothetical protein